MDEATQTQTYGTEASVSQAELGYAAKVPFPITVKADWLQKGILVLPQKLADYIVGSNTIHLLYDEVDDLLPYEEHHRTIEGAYNFYQSRSVEQGDTVRIQLRGIHPTELYITTSIKDLRSDLNEQEADT